MTTKQIRLTKPQLEFVNAVDQFPCVIAGFGAGKTQAAVVRALVKKLKYPGQNVAYYLPTYDLVRNIGFPRFMEVLEQFGVEGKLNRSNAVIDIEGAGSIIFRTMDTPERIVGYEVADSLVDELDTLKTEQARAVWNKIISRNRQKKPDGSLNTVAVATTPEGFRFVYERWKKSPAPGYRIIKATTYSNSRNLPAGYIDSLKASYPSALLAAYLDGEFVNLTAGSVYPGYDRGLNASTETIRPGEALHVGLDFNVTKMAAVIHVLRDGEPHAVMEYTDVFDTPAMIALIKSQHPGHPIMVYPDASGGSRKANNASVTDLSLLRSAGFTVCVNSQNPAVKDRILSVNALIHKDEQRRYRVNVDTCPHLVESLEKQAYDKYGEPDKAGGLDHVIDAAGYFIAYKFPLVKRTANKIELRAF
ncbi:MAG: terminase [Alcaligenaceae bacterium]|nr:terminase [Alcaligenaceae bacterium]